MRHILEYNNFLDLSKYTIINEAVFDIDDKQFNKLVTKITKYPPYFLNLKKYINENDYISFVGELLNQMSVGNQFNAEEFVAFKELQKDFNEDNFVIFTSQIKRSLEDWKELYGSKNFANIHKEDVSETLPNLFNYIKAYAKNGELSYTEFLKLATVIKKSPMCIDYIILMQFAENNNVVDELIIFFNGMQSYLTIFSDDELMKKFNLMLNQSTIKVGTKIVNKPKGSSTTVKNKSTGNSTKITPIDFPGGERTLSGLLTFETVAKKMVSFELTPNKSNPAFLLEVAKVVGYQVLEKASAIKGEGKQYFTFVQEADKVTCKIAVNTNVFIRQLLKTLSNTDITKLDKDKIVWSIPDLNKE